MTRKLVIAFCVLFITAGLVGCAENEYKTTQKKEVQTESEPQDSSPGQMVVE